MTMTKRKADLILLFVAIIWGSGFVLTRVAVDMGVSPGGVNFFRGFFFTICALILFRKQIFTASRRDLKVAFIAGILNFGGFIFQTIGVQYTTPSNSAFLTVTNVVIVPFLAFFIYKQRVRLKSFVSILFCLLGMVLLTGLYDSAISLNIGDFYTLICAFFYASFIVYVGYSARQTSTGVLSFMIGLTQMAGGLLYVYGLEGGDWSGVNWLVALVPLAYLGIICSFAALTLQVFSQKHTDATSAALIMMLEGVFGSIFSVLFGFEFFTMNLVLGGGLIMVSLVLCEVDFKDLKRLLSKKPSLVETGEPPENDG